MTCFVSSVLAFGTFSCHSWMGQVRHHGCVFFSFGGGPTVDKSIHSSLGLQLPRSPRSVPGRSTSASTSPQCAEEHGWACLFFSAAVPSSGRPIRKAGDAHRQHWCALAHARAVAGRIQDGGGWIARSWWMDVWEGPRPCLHVPVRSGRWRCLRGTGTTCNLPRALFSSPVPSHRSPFACFRSGGAASFGPPQVLPVQPSSCCLLLLLLLLLRHVAAQPAATDATGSSTSCRA